jgi:hypothetical protein
MHTQTNAGQTGSSRSRWNPETTRDIVARVLRDMPTASAADQIQRYHELLGRYPHCQRAVNEHSFETLKKDFRATRSKAKHDEEREARDEPISELADSMAEEIKLRILDFVMPNNKPLRDCTGSEVASFDIKIAEKVGPDQRVGDLLTDREAADLIG